MYTPRKRTGFTLIELLVVIAIIAILVSLLGAAVFYVFVRAKDAQCRAEIAELTASTQEFKKLYKIYPPDKIRLYSRASDYRADGSPFALASLSYLNTIWPNIGDFGNPAVSAPVPWIDGTTVFPAYSAGFKGIDLTGDQCLVFFLGGIPGGPGGMGFSKDPKNPAQLGGTRNGPLFEFNSSRLKFNQSRATGGQSNADMAFKSYYDPFELQAYIYLSSTSLGNAANKYDPNYAIAISDVLNTPPANVTAYFQAPKQFNNPNSFQIISAGRDGKFNNGSYQWAPATASNIAPTGQDDLTNISDSRMGVPR